MSRGEFQTRKDWSLQMQERYAIPIYKTYWRISEDQITEVDAGAENEEIAREIDASGIDKLVQPDTGVRHLAQRFRTLCELDGGAVVDPDFSIRISSYSDMETEYDKLLNAFRNEGNIPKIYTFAIGASTSKRDCLRVGFKEFYFLRLPKFLKLFDGGHIQPCASYENGDGSRGLYFDVQDLRDNHVVQDAISGTVLSSAWEEGPVSDDFPTAPGIDDTGQLNLFDFGGGE